MFAIRLPPDIEARLASLARRLGHSQAHCAREAIQGGLEDLEDFYSAEERMLGYSPAKSIPLEEVLRRHSTPL